MQSSIDMRKCAFLSVLILLLIVGCSSNKAELEEAELRRAAITKKVAVSEAAGESVLVVGGEVITSSEIIQSLTKLFKPVAQKINLEQFKEWARPQIEQTLMDRLSEILLYQEAKRQAGKNVDESLEKAADMEMRRFVLNFGGDEAKAEEKLKQIGMDRKSFKENRKKYIITQWYLASKLSENKPVTYSELINYYEQMKEQSFVMPAKLQFQLIDIQPAKLQIPDSSQDRLEQARKLANKLVRQIRAGADFGELAKQHSHGHRRAFGGLWKPVQPESLAEPYDILAAEAEKIEQGKIAGPIETEGHIFIVKLQEKQPKSYEPFDKVQRQLEEKIIIDRRKGAIDKLNAELMRQVVLDGKEEFIDFCVEKIYKMKETLQ